MTAINGSCLRKGIWTALGTTHMIPENQTMPIHQLLDIVKSCASGKNFAISTKVKNIFVNTFLLALDSQKTTNFTISEIGDIINKSNSAIKEQFSNNILECFGCNSNDVWISLCSSICLIAIIYLIMNQRKTLY